MRHTHFGPARSNHVCWTAQKTLGSKTKYLIKLQNNFENPCVLRMINGYTSHHLSVYLPTCLLYVPLILICVLTCTLEMPSELGVWRREELDLDKSLDSFWPPTWPQFCFASDDWKPWALPPSRMTWLSDLPFCSVHAGNLSGHSRVPLEPAPLVLHSGRTLTRVGNWWRLGTAAERSQVLFFLSLSCSFFPERA